MGPDGGPKVTSWGVGALESLSWIMSEGPQGHELLLLLLATGQEVLLTLATGQDLWHSATGQGHSLSLSLLVLGLSL